MQEESIPLPSGRRYRLVITKTSCFWKLFLTSCSSEAAVNPCFFKPHSASVCRLYVITLNSLPAPFQHFHILFWKMCPLWCNTRFSYPPRLRVDSSCLGIITLVVKNTCSVSSVVPLHIWHNADTHLNTKTSVSCLYSIRSQYLNNSVIPVFAILSVTRRSEHYFQIAYLALTFLISLCFWSCFLVLICFPSNLTFACFFDRDSAC